MWPPACMAARILPFLLALAAAAGPSAASVCPSVTKAARHYRLVVLEGNITLPGGGILSGLQYNGSYIGPTLTATLGEDISIDVVNNASQRKAATGHGLCSARAVHVCCVNAPACPHMFSPWVCSTSPRVPTTNLVPCPVRSDTPCTCMLTCPNLLVATSVHWHGQRQTGSSWADGVAGVSQRPIPPGGTFRYRFKAQPAGTFWYHSHVGQQTEDGLHGPLIIKVHRMNWACMGL